MIDISAVGTVITFEGSGLGEVTFNDASDMASPIEFGTINPLNHEFDLNTNMMVYHRQVAPELSLSFIPGSASDRRLRAFLLSSVLDVNSFKSVSDVKIDEVMIQYPRDGEKVILHDGYLVGGSVGLGVSNDGRLTSAPYRFVFKSAHVAGGSGFGFGAGEDYAATQLCKDGSEIEGLYYARVSGNSGARMISHPVETGAVIYDQKYMEPEHVSVKVKIPMALAQSVVSEFFTILADRSIKDGRTPYSIYTKTEQYDNLSLVRITHDESPDQFDLMEYNLEFQEVMFSSTTGSKDTRDASDRDQPLTKTTGTQATRPTA